MVGPQWNVPVAENDNGFNLISSPMPKPDMSSRVIANDLPAKTYSPTAFDLPMRKDVIQTTIPNSVTRTFETSSDPRFPPKRPVSTVSGVLYHGTASTDPKVIHGIETNFLEKSKKSAYQKGEKIDFDVKKVQDTKAEALNAAKGAYNSSSAMLDSITGSVAPNQHMILNAQNLNKKEQNDLKLYEDNKTKEKRMEELKHTPAGVRALHTPKRFI